MSANSFCKHLSNGFRIFIKNDKITWMPCCYWTGEPYSFAAEEIQTKRKIINIETPWVHKECAVCHNEEVQTGTSYRQGGNKNIIGNSNLAKWIDIQADFTCNGGCLICGPWSSSYWQSEIAKYNGYKLETTADRTLKNNIDHIFTTLDVSELNVLQFLGGEPFLSKADSYGIPYVQNPEICTLKYTTNGSIYPSTERIDQWKNFKNIILTLSIDAIGSRFDYLRYPLKWSTVENNIQRMINELPDNVEFSINHSLTPLNIYYYDEFVAWTEQMFAARRLRRIHTHTAFGIMHVNGVSQTLFNRLLEKYADHWIMNLITDPTAGHQEFKNYINTWELRRSNSWKAVFPDIADLL